MFEVCQKSSQFLVGSDIQVEYLVTRSKAGRMELQDFSFQIISLFVLATEKV